MAFELSFFANYVRSRNLEIPWSDYAYRLSNNSIPGLECSGRTKKIMCVLPRGELLTLWWLTSRDYRITCQYTSWLIRNKSRYAHPSNKPFNATALSSYFFNPYSAGIDFSRQNLTSVDVRFWRLKSIQALWVWYYLDWPQTHNKVFKWIRKS